MVDHREVRRKDKEVTDPKWIEEILKRGQTLHMGLAEEGGRPYVVTMCYAYRDGAIYVHGAPVGKKNEILAVNPRVCFQVALDVEVAPAEVASKFSMKYRSVTGFGVVRTLTGPDERREALNILMDHFAGPHVDLKDVSDRVWVARIDVERMTGKKSVYPD